LPSLASAAVAILAPVAAGLGDGPAAGLAVGYDDGLAYAVDGVVLPHAAVINVTAAAKVVNKNFDCI
jgi:hypothetical protein